MWLGNRCDPPKDVQAALEALFGQPVGHVKVIQYSLYVRFHMRAIATTPSRDKKKNAPCRSGAPSIVGSVKGRDRPGPAAPLRVASAE